MTFAAALLAAGLALAQHPEAPPSPHGAVVPSEAHPAAAAPGHEAAGHEVAGRETAGHGGGHGNATLPEVMLHHVANGYVLEVPGFCEGWHWNCEIDLRELSGTTWDPATGKNVSGPLVLAGGKLDLTPSKHVVMMWIAAALLLVMLLVAVRRRALVPRGLYNFFELLVQFVRDIAVSNIGKRDADRFVPYLCAAFFFILFMNLLGLVPYMATATANISVTVALALFTFFITQYAAIRAQGVGGYLAHLTGGVPKSLWPLWAVMIPVEFLGLFTKPFALTVRLFANMVAGHFVILALLGLIFAISIFVAPASVALALAIFMLELFVAFVQAYIFTMLSALFIGAGLAHGDGHGEHGPAARGEAPNASHVAGTSPGHG
jgi:F-type H+-transporting ATPase subunit a